MTLALVVFGTAGVVSCESSEDATRSGIEGSKPAVESQLGAAVSIAVCHPEIAEIFVRLGAAPKLVAVDSDSVRVDGVSQVADLGPGCSGAAGPMEVLAPTAILSLSVAQSRSGVPFLSGVGSSPRHWELDPKSLDEIVDAIRKLGELVALEDRARIEIARITRALASIAVRRDGRTRWNVAWIIDREPLTVVGGTGLLHELLELAGAENVFHDPSGSRFEVAPNEIRERSPDFVLVPAGHEDLTKALGLPSRVVPLELARVPTLQPVARLTALHEILYPDDR